MSLYAMTNEQRADRAYRMLLCRNEGQDIETLIVDALTDLMHLCPQYGEDFDNSVRMARMHFEAECEEDQLSDD